LAAKPTVAPGRIRRLPRPALARRAMGFRALRSALSPAEGRLTILYLVFATAANVLWETGQLPLYTIWQTGTRGELAFAALHCTAGDVVVLTAAFLLALLLTGGQDWPREGFGRVTATVILLGTAYTTYSEWKNVEVLRNWAYASSMPLLPPLGTGLAPLMQWALIPPSALRGARWMVNRSKKPSKKPG